MNGHEIAERSRLLSHRHYAEVIDVNLDLIEQARVTIATVIERDGGTTGQQLWALILRRSWGDIRRRMLEDGPEGRLLRSNSPFSTLVGITDIAQRTRIWRQAKQELSAQKTSTERSAV